MVTKTLVQLRLAVCALLLVASVIGGYILRDQPLWFLPLLCLAAGFYAALVSHMFIGLIPRWRNHFLSVGCFCILVILFLSAYLASSFHFWSRDKQMARDYVAAVQPRLEDFRKTHGQYPNSLSEVDSLPATPVGLAYNHEHNGGKDTYRFHYWNTCEYWSGTGQWVDDD
jgi:hypothetical protein